jgi:hypothetical protein
MSEPNSNPPPKPPVISSPAAPAALGELAAERVPITGPVTAVEAVLREPRRVVFQLTQPGARRVSASLLLAAIGCAAVYGLVVGTFSGGDQLWAAPLKIVVGLLLSATICLPSLYVFACLSGSRARLADLCGLVAGMLALAALLLSGFAPVAWVFSESTESVAGIGTIHLGFWLVAGYFGLRFLHAGFKWLDARGTGGLAAWVVVFMLVTLQMTAALRPIVGTAPTFLPTEKKFFLSHWFDCATGAVKEKSKTMPRVKVPARFSS